MSAYPDLDDIFHEAVNVDHALTDPIYAVEMHGKIADLLDASEQRVHLLSAELAVTRADLAQVENDREAVQRYLGISLATSGASLPIDPVETLRGRVLLVARNNLPDRKIMAIKDLRADSIAGEAWIQLGGQARVLPDGTVNRTMSLKDAKDIVDTVASGRLYTPRGLFPL